jgi:hypothetical protein
LSDYWVVTSDVRKAATVDVEREDPLDLLDCRRDYRRGQRVAPVNRAVCERAVSPLRIWSGDTGKESGLLLIRI